MQIFLSWARISTGSVVPRSQLLTTSRACEPPEDLIKCRLHFGSLRWGPRPCMSTELPGGTDAVRFWGQHPEHQVSDYVIQPQDPIQVASMVIKWAATNRCHIGHHLSCCSPWCERMRKLQASCPYSSFLSPRVAREFISANIDGETFHATL